MQTAVSETESKYFDLRTCMHHYTLRAPCPKGQGTGCVRDFAIFSMCEPAHTCPVRIPSCDRHAVARRRVPSHIEAHSAHVMWTRGDAPWACLAI